MSEPLVVIIPHKLGKAEAARRIKSSIGNVSSALPMLAIEEQRWSEDRMDFRATAMAQAVSGHLEVADTSVRLEIVLPWLLGKFAHAVQKAFAGQLGVLLEKK